MGEGEAFLLEKPFMRPWCLESGSLTWVPLIALGRNTRRGRSRELDPAHSATGCISNSPAEPPSRCPGRGEDQTPWRGRGRGSDPLGRTGARIRPPGEDGGRRPPPGRLSVHSEGRTNTEAPQYAPHQISPLCFLSHKRKNTLFSHFHLSNMCSHPRVDRAAFS